MLKYTKFRRRYRADHYNLARQHLGDWNLPQSEFGILYLALGAEHASLTTLSISSLRRVGYSGPIRVVTDADACSPENRDSEIIPLDTKGNPWSPRYFKTQINRYAFPTTLFLDTDMIAISPIDSLWAGLQYAEICMSLELPRVQNFIDYYWERSEPMRPELSYMRQSGLTEHPFYNSGMILFRHSAAVDLAFDTWHEEWKRFGGRDQCALVRALARTGMKVHALPTCWNSPPTRFNSLQEARSEGVKFLHFFTGPQRSRLLNFVEDWA